MIERKPIAIRVRNLLEFFDENRDARRHSNAIKTFLGEELMFALLIECLNREGVEAVKHSKPCTEGKRQGNQLDGWIKAKNRKTLEMTCYQVEVKFWSGHGVGDHVRYFNPNKDDPAEYSQEMWKRVWSAEDGFKPPRLQKLLKVMKYPDDDSPTILPLACLWAMLHPEGKPIPFFEVDAPPSFSSNFHKVAVFSASTFLRNISEEVLTLKLDQFVERRSLLDQFFAN